MKHLTALINLEFKLTLRYFIVVFFALAFPVLMLLMFGGIYGNEPTPFFGGYGSVDVSVPAYMSMIIAVTGIMVLPLNLVNYRETKVLKRFMATPIRTYDLLISQVVVNVMLTCLGVLLLVVIGMLVFNMQIIGNVLQIIIAFFISLLSMFALGFIIASLCTKERTASLVANLLYFPMIFLTGATIPLEIMPDYMVTISKVLPLSYVVNLQKGIWLGGSLSDHATELVVLLAILIAGTLISLKSFKWE